MKITLATKCKRPKMSEFRGRTWDYINVLVGGMKYRAYYDTSWGLNAYFENAGQWYRVSLDYANADCTLIDLDNPKTGQ